MRLLVVKRVLAVAGCGAMLAPCAPRAGEPAPAFTLEESLAQGRFSLELRPRYNRIDESGYPKRTEVGTVRAVAGWRSAPSDWRVALEAIHADHIGSALNDDGAQLATSPYPLLPDPRYTGVNQAHVEYSGVDGLRLRMGRQLVRIDNQRWVSDNDFRQTPQLFDGVGAVYEGIASAELSGGAFWRLRTTSGNTDALRLSFLRGAWNPAPGHALSAYAIFHDQAQNGAFTGFADNSYRVAGVKAEGSAASIAGIDIPYLLEYAAQRPYAGGDGRIDADYRRAGAGIAGASWALRYDLEVKGSNAGAYGMQMPLTDFYAFNGWTLHFYNTPRQGLRDGWLTLRLAAAGVTFYAEHHRFRSDYASLDFGRELDASIAGPIGQHALLRLQHARYDPASGTTDPRIRKTWLTLTLDY
ncbi:MAG: alginate export family protein [Usitatibacter sp.]